MSDNKNHSVEKIMMFIEKILEDPGVTDVHLRAGDVPWVRSGDGGLGPHSEVEAMTSTDISDIEAYMVPRTGASFEKTPRSDYSVNLPSGVRVRVKRAKAMGRSQIFLRRLFSDPPSVEELGIDTFFAPALHMRPGIIWVCGPTGSGKTTFLASILSWYALGEPCHIVTIEDPVEYLLRGAAGTVSQRRVGDDVESFHEGLRGALREDPDIIMIGEVRDSETVLAALSAAETGHLVFATIHAPDVAGIVERAIGMFPQVDRHDKCIRLAQTFRGACALRLAVRSGGGRIWLHEVAWGDNSVKNLIREGKVHQIRGNIETRRSSGMHTLEQSVRESVESGLVGTTEGERYLSDEME